MELHTLSGSLGTGIVIGKRMGAKTREIKASHVSFISNPSEIAQVVESAAASISLMRVGARKRLTGTA